MAIPQSSYTDGMTHKVGPKGQVVIPKAMREELGIEPGDEVDFELVDGGVVVRRAVRPVEALRGIFREYDLLADLEAEHRAEMERDERKWGP